MTKLLALCAAIALAGCAGCGGTTKPDTGGTGTGTGGGGGGSGSGTAATGGGGGTAPAAPITDAECDAMIDHIIDLGVAEQAPAERPTADQIAEIKARPLTDKDKAKCQAFPRKNFDCVMAATTAGALEPCDQE
jgi:hypothetical protein